MEVVFVSVGNFQEYVIDNIKNLLFFGNKKITLITNKEFFKDVNHLPIKLIDSEELLDDEEFINNIKQMENSRMEKCFRNGFWHYSSLRLFYLYYYLKKYNIKNCIHLENDVVTYINFDELIDKFKENKVYAPFDHEKRVIAGIVYIPNYEAFHPIIKNYNYHTNDMENLAQYGEEVILSLPIFPIICPEDKITKYNKLYYDFNMIFDGAAIGQYLGGVDPRNVEEGLNTKGFVNETCIIKYNNYEFIWESINGLYIPFLVIDKKKYRICNLHIHSKKLKDFIYFEEIL